MDTTSDITVKSTETGDTTSGIQNELKNFAKNICVAKYPYWHMKKIDRYVKTISRYKNIYDK